MAYDTAAPRTSVGVLGPALAGLGGVLVLVAYLALDWLDVTTVVDGADGDASISRSTLTLREIADHREAAAASSVVAHDYLTWLSWTLLLATLVLAGAAAIRRADALRWRVAGALAGVASAALTWTATTHFFQGRGDSSFPTHDGFAGAGVGAHVAFAGFLLCAVGAAVGPLGPGRTRASTTAPTNATETAPMTARFPRPALLGAGAGALGGVLAVLALAGLTWYDTTGRDLPENFGFADFGSYADDDPSVLVRAWFPDLAWVALAVAVAGVALAAASPLFAALGRALAVLGGVGGAALVLLVLHQLLSRDTAPFTGLFDGMSAGVPVLVVGLLLCAGGGVLAARPHVRGARGLGSPRDERAVGATTGEVGQRP